MKTLSPAAARNMWIGLMTIASTLMTLVLACATPFPALTALAAVHVRRTEGLLLIGAAWIMSQAVGFGLLDYPVDATNVAWSVALGTASVGSLLIARLSIARLSGVPVIARLIVAYVTAYVGFKIVVLGWSFVLDDGWAAFTAKVLLRQFLRYGAILIGLVLLHRVLEVAGIRGLRQPAAAQA
jgi:hypothetical protein